MTEAPELTAPADQAARQKGERIAVRWLPLEALRLDKRNARVHSARQIARIADSITAFGFNVPVLVDEEGGVVAGHARVLAARRLKLKDVPTIALGHLDEMKRRAFMIADNRLAELAAWDGVRLGLELAELKSLDLDFDLRATGFSLCEIDLKLEAVEASGGRKPARRGRAATRPGDVWTLGSSRLACGDDVDHEGLLALDGAIRRWEAMSGDNARLGSSGETFDAVARARRRAQSSGARGAVA